MIEYIENIGGKQIVLLQDVLYFGGGMPGTPGASLLPSCLAGWGPYKDLARKRSPSSRVFAMALWDRSSINLETM